MIVRGPLHKMHTRLGQPVGYQLTLGNQSVQLEQFLGQAIRIDWQGQINCVHCGRVTNKSFNQGYCYPCFRSLAQCDVCIVSPEKCHFAEGTCREPEWARQHCFQPHIVYLSNTSGLKIGITRQSQIPTRWIDQGARQAMAVIKVSERFHAGLVETAFKDYINDRTNWRNMLKDLYVEEDMPGVFNELWPKVSQALDDELLSQVEVIAGQETPVRIDYPAHSFPSKITSLNLDKNPTVSGLLMAIKGQYLILDSGVINIRKFAGYQVELETGQT